MKEIVLQPYELRKSSSNPINIVLTFTGKERRRHGGDTALLPTMILSTSSSKKDELRKEAIGEGGVETHRDIHITINCRVLCRKSSSTTRLRRRRWSHRLRSSGEFSLEASLGRC
ncbi:unnamed protein product [Victoria cruziana]